MCTFAQYVLHSERIQVLSLTRAAVLFTAAQLVMQPLKQRVPEHERNVVAEVRSRLGVVRLLDLSAGFCLNFKCRFQRSKLAQCRVLI